MLHCNWAVYLYPFSMVVFKRRPKDQMPIVKAELKAEKFEAQKTNTN